MTEVELLAEHAAGAVDDLLGDLRTLEHRLPEDGERAGEAREHAEGDVAGAVGLDVAAAASCRRGVELPQAATTTATAIPVSRRFGARVCGIRAMAVGDTVQPPSVARRRAVPDTGRESAPTWITMSMGQWIVQFLRDNPRREPRHLAAPSARAARVCTRISSSVSVSSSSAPTSASVSGSRRSASWRRGSQVSRASLRQALAVLEAQGFIEVRHGGGVFLRRSRGFGGVLHKLVERRARLPEVLEARELLEVRLAELAATRRTDDDLIAMRAALVAMEAEIASAGLGMDGDAAFHHAVHRAGNNKVLEHVIDGLADAIHETRMESLSRAGPPEELAAGPSAHPRRDRGADRRRRGGRDARAPPPGRRRRPAPLGAAGRGSRRCHDPAVVARARDRRRRAGAGDARAGAGGTTASANLAATCDRLIARRGEASGSGARDRGGARARADEQRRDRRIPRGAGRLVLATARRGRRGSRALAVGSDRRGGDGARDRHRGTSAGAVPAAQHGRRRRSRAREVARPAARTAPRASAPPRRRCRPAPSALVVVQRRLPASRADQLGDAGGDAGTVDRLRGRARDPRLGRPAPAPRRRPALLRVLPPAAPGRTADLRGDRAHPRAADRDRPAPRGGTAHRRRSRRRTPPSSTRSAIASRACAGSPSETS